MATSEEEIKKGVVLLLERYGSLDTSEVKKHLNTVMPFDEEDMKPSVTRNEPLILQRIGNIVSHQKYAIERYYDLYEIDKNKKPAVWTLLKGLKTKGTLQTLSIEEIEVKKEQMVSFEPRKVNWEDISKNRSELGLQGEKFVMRYETGRVLEYANADTARIVHLSEEQGDGAGFDIVSVNEDGSSRYIEVKTTKANLDTPFYMSENEKSFFEKNKENGNVFIYRVYNFDDNKKEGKVKIISSADLFSDYVFDPISYKVTKRQNLINGG